MLRLAIVCLGLTLASCNGAPPPISDAAQPDAVVDDATPPDAPVDDAEPADADVDTQPPETTITSAPDNPNPSATSTFEFTSDDAGAAFECRRDGDAYAACTSPQPYAGLGDGAHTFDVRAVDSAGNVDASAASWSWTIDTAPPTISSVTSSTNDGGYTVGDVIVVQVIFSEAVVVTGAPILTLETGANDRAAAYTSGSGTTTLELGYTVRLGDASLDLDYVATAALALNGGTISDLATNGAGLTLAPSGAAGSLGAAKALVVDAAFVINELLHDPAGSDSTTTEFIELRGPPSFDLTGIRLDFFNAGASNAIYQTITLTGLNPADGLLVIGGPSGDLSLPAVIQNGPDSVRLHDADDTLLDALAYGNFTGSEAPPLGEGSPAPATSANTSLARCATVAVAAADTGDNNDDFHSASSLTPGAPNVGIGVACGETP